MALPPVLNSIVGWLRAGYPHGVPEHDYVALLALLSRRLTSEEVAAVAAELSRQSSADGGAGTAATNGSADIPGIDTVADATGNGAAAAAGATPSGGVAVDNSDIGVLITKITNELPREEDIERVRAHLVEAGPFL
jgi:hypothetical protein